MLVNLNKILVAARRGGYAVGAFNINNLETAQAAVAAAAALRAPIILQTSTGALEYAGLEYLAPIAYIAGQLHKIPVVVHLDHGKDEALVEKVIKSGWYTSVMIDAAYLPYAQNVRITKKIVALAHSRGISVEAELGAIFDTKIAAAGTKSQALFTDPVQAARFVAETKCDALAVAIGTAHGAIKYATGEKPQLDLARLKEIARLVKIPLVLHGASNVPAVLLKQMYVQCERVGDCERVGAAVGVPESEIKKAIKLGVAKINVDTDIRLAFTGALRQTILENKTTWDPRKILGPARTATQEMIRVKIKLFGWK